MGQKVLLINPSPRPTRRRKKPRTAAQKRATAKMLAANKKRRAATRRRKNPSTRTTTKRKTTMKKRRTAAQRAATRKMIAANKRRRRRPTARRRPARRRRNPISRTAAFRTVRTGGASSRAARRRNPVRRRRARRRNPIRRGMVNRVVMPAVTAATGALALDVAWAYLPLPPQLRTGPFKYLAKAGGALGLAWLAEMVVKRQTAEALGVGALTVVIHQMARDLIAQNMPTLRMDGLGYYNAGLPVGGQEANMGLYVGNQSPGMPAGDGGMGLYTDMNGYSREGGYTYS